MEQTPTSPTGEGAAALCGRKEELEVFTARACQCDMCRLSLLAPSSPVSRPWSQGLASECSPLILNLSKDDRSNPLKRGGVLPLPTPQA